MHFMVYTHSFCSHVQVLPTCTASAHTHAHVHTCTHALSLSVYLALSSLSTALCTVTPHIYIMHICHICTSDHIEKRAGVPFIILDYSLLVHRTRT